MESIICIFYSQEKTGGFQKYLQLQQAFRALSYLLITYPWGSAPSACLRGRRETILISKSHLPKGISHYWVTIHEMAQASSNLEEARETTLGELLCPQIQPF